MATDGGGGGSSYFAAEPVGIATAGSYLEERANEVSQGRTYGAVLGLGDAMSVNDSVYAFIDRWQFPLDRWQRSLASLGSAVKGSAKVIQDQDEGSKQSWQSMMGGMP